MNRARRTLLLALVSTSLPLARPSIARAEQSLEEPPASPPDLRHAPHGLQLGARVGVALPAGRYMGSQDRYIGFTVDPAFDKYQVAEVPIWIDLGYRIGHVVLAAYGSLGPVTLAHCASCSATDVRFGVEGAYRFAPDANIDPWIGVGSGWEINALSYAFSDQTGSTAYSGWEIANLQAGVDFALGNGWRAGPFVAATFAMFTNPDDAVDLVGVHPDRAIHGWGFLGARGVWEPTALTRTR